MASGKEGRYIVPSWKRQIWWSSVNLGSVEATCFINIRCEIRPTLSVQRLMKDCGRAPPILSISTTKSEYWTAVRFLCPFQQSFFGFRLWLKLGQDAEHTNRCFLAWKWMTMRPCFGYNRFNSDVYSMLCIWAACLLFMALSTDISVKPRWDKTTFC